MLEYYVKIAPQLNEPSRLSRDGVRGALRELNRWSCLLDWLLLYISYAGSDPAVPSYRYGTYYSASCANYLSSWG